MTDNQNHTSEIALPPDGWRFVGADGGDDCGQARDGGAGFALVIEHAAYAEGSRWEQALRGLSPGLLLTLKGRARTQGPCQKDIGENCFMAGGARIILEAFAVSEAAGQVSLGAVEHPFFPPLNPDGTIPEGADMAGVLHLVVPDGAEFVRVSAELSGQGRVTFSALALTAAETGAGSMNDALIDSLKAEGTIHSPSVEEAFRRVPRHHFLPGINGGRVYQDDAIATHFAEGTEVSISSSSQPTIMALMLEQLQVAPGMRILEVGAGTGYNAALLAQLAGGGENVWTVDMDEPFCAEARVHLAAAGISNVHVVCADGWGGWPDAAPYDRIIGTFSAHDISPRWFEQLREGGRLALPWGAPDRQQRSAAFRKENGRLIMESLHFCSFMPIRGAHAWSPPDGGAGRQWRDWLFPGQPKGDPTTLVAYPLGTAPPADEGQYLIKRTWFEYVASWA